MRTLIAFENVSLDGFFVDAKGDMSWAHRQDPEWNEFTAKNAGGGDGMLLFGRVTYDMMASFWPTPAAKEMLPTVADAMNAMPKAVVSRTMDEAGWNNTTVLKGDLATSVRDLKKSPGHDIAILGSGSIVSQLAAAGLIDEIHLAIHPIVLGKGRKLFDGIPRKIGLKRIDARTFQNGNVFAKYKPLEA